jgi:hypothetical protein
VRADEGSLASARHKFSVRGYFEEVNEAGLIPVSIFDGSSPASTRQPESGYDKLTDIDGQDG